MWVWQARLDPRRNTPSIGIYSHVKDRWGSEPERYAAHTREYLGWGVFALMPR